MSSSLLSRTRFWWF